MIAVTLAAALALAPLDQQPGPPPAPPHAPEAEALRVFLDCSYWCDVDFLRTEITFVSWVRDRADADVHVLVTTQSTGSGGTEFTLTFIGLRRLAGHTDTLTYSSGGTDTGDETRHGLAHTLKVGLVRYVAGTPLMRDLDIGYRPSRGAGGAPPPPPQAGHDPWNYWVFQVGTNGNFNGERGYRYRYVSGRLTATRITDAWRMEFSLNGSNNLNRYQLDSVTWYGARSERYHTSGEVVRSLGGHWSAGLNASASRSTYSNIDLQVDAKPAVEFDVFPYNQSTRRLLTLRYGIGLEYSRYRDTTIYFRIRETRPQHSLDVSFSMTQPWGNASLSVDASQYLHDLSKRQVSFFGNWSVRLVRGLSLNWYGGYSIIHDQLALPAAGATPEEILVRQRQLATSYSYWGGFGVSYRFGSIFNNVVNPRFGNGGGGGVIIMM